MIIDLSEFGQLSYWDNPSVAGFCQRPFIEKEIWTQESQRREGVETFWMESSE